MAKLLIYRGDVLEREVDLDGRTALIGRDDGNDIVLPDPGKSVSRVHAELRCEQGKYSVTDRNSQNGIWVAGHRVTSTELEPGVPVLLGSFKLLLKADRPPAPVSSSDKTMLLPREDAANAPTLLIPMPTPGSAPPAPKVSVAKAESPVAPAPPRAPEVKPEPKPAVPSAVEKAKIAPKPEEAPPAPKPAPPPVPKAAPPPPPPPPAQMKKAEPPPPAKPAATAKPARSGGSKRLLVSAVAASVVAAATAAVYFTVLRRQAPPVASNSSNSKTGTEQKKAAQKAEEQPKQSGTGGTTSAATTSGGDAGGAKTGAAKTGATATQAAATKGGTPTETAPKGNPNRATTTGRAANTGETGNPPRAPVVVPSGGEQAPPASAGGGQRPPAQTTAKPPVKPVPPPPPPPSPPQPKPLDLAATYREARLELMKADADFLKAIALLESVVKVNPDFVDGAYANAITLLKNAQSSARDHAVRSVERGESAEMTGDYAGAKKLYERAQLLDPQSGRAKVAMGRLELVMLKEGEKIFSAAQQADSLSNNSKAIAGYERALELLPADHEKAKLARERLKVLKGGGDESWR